MQAILTYISINFLIAHRTTALLLQKTNINKLKQFFKNIKPVKSV